MASTLGPSAHLFNIMSKPLNFLLRFNWILLCCTLRSWVHQISMLFRTFSPRLEDIDTFQWSSDSFPHWPHISGCVKNCQNYFSIYRCSPIARRRSWKSVPNLSHSYVPFQDLLPAIWEQWYIKKRPRWSVPISWILILILRTLLCLVIFQFW